MKNPMVLTLLLCLLAAPLLAQKEHEQALAFMKSGNYKDALAMLEESIASHPDWYFPILLKGQCNLRLKKYEDALRNFNDALTLEVPSKDIPRVKYYIAQTYLKMKSYAKAIHAYNEIVPLVPKSKHFDVFYSRGQCELQIAKANESKDPKKAGSYFSKAVVSFSDALKNQTQNKNLRIEAAFQQAYAQYKIGDLEGGLQSLEKSIQAFGSVIKINPKEKRAHDFIVNLAFRLTKEAPADQKAARYAESVRYIDDYLKNWPNDLDMINKKGLALQGAKNYKEAVEVFKYLLTKKPKDGEAWYSLGSCQMADKRYKDAIASFKKALANGQSKNHAVYSYSAYCYQQQKTSCYGSDIPLYQSAVDILEKGIGVVPGRGKAELQKDLGSKQQNLTILKDNFETDKQNHKNALENIGSIQKTINANTSKLEKNQEFYINQPTEELKAAIDASKEAIRADKESLQKELKGLQDYVKEAKKCGGAKTFPSYNDMLAVLKENGR